MPAIRRMRLCRPWHHLAVALMAACLLAATPARASGPDVPPAGVQPLAALLARVRADFGEAKIVKVEIEETQSQGVKIPAYEVKLFTPRGAIMKVLYDARTLERLSVQGRRKYEDDD